MCALDKLDGHTHTRIRQPGKQEWMRYNTGCADGSPQTHCYYYYYYARARTHTHTHTHTHTANAAHDHTFSSILNAAKRQHHAISFHLNCFIDW